MVAINQRVTYQTNRTVIVRLVDMRRSVPYANTDNGHKALMPIITARPTGHNARNAPGIIG